MTEDKLGRQLAEQFGAQINNQLYWNFEKRHRERHRTQTDDPIDGQLQAGAWRHLDTQLYWMLRGQIWDQIRMQLYRQIKEDLTNVRD